LALSLSDFSKRIMAAVRDSADAEFRWEVTIKKVHFRVNGVRVLQELHVVRNLIHVTDITAKNRKKVMGVQRFADRLPLDC
jgi:hypothetical protein